MADEMDMQQGVFENMMRKNLAAYRERGKEEQAQFDGGNYRIRI